MTYQKEFSINTEEPSIGNKDFYTPPEAAKLFGISRASIYRYMAGNAIKAVQFRRKTLVRRKDIEILFENAVEYKKIVPIEKAPITDFYTTAEVKEKYHVNESRQTALHYGLDEFSSYLILVVRSIVIGVIFLNLQMVFRQLLSPTIGKCFMRFECYRNKAIAVEDPVVHSKLAKSTINSEPIISEPKPEIEIETTSDTTEEVSTPPFLEPIEDVAELPKEESTPSTINNMPIEESKQLTEYEIFRANAMAEKGRASQEKLDKVLAYTKQNLVLYLSEMTLIVYVDILQNTTYPIPCLKLSR